MWFWDLTRGEDYFSNPQLFGVTIGPNANRVGGAAFTLNGKEYHLAVNDGPNNLHSDMDGGYHKGLWAAEEDGDSLKLTIEGKDGELGFPGNKRVTMTYTLTDNNELRLKYHATSDMETLLNLTNHTYFNLAGHDSGSMEGQFLRLNAANFTPVLPGAIPTGEIAPVAGTPLDFTEKKQIGKEIGADYEQLKLVQGYDHNFVIDGADGTMREAAEAEDVESGRRMKVFTNLPGMQFYAGNCIAEQSGKGGVHYGPAWDSVWKPIIFRITFTTPISRRRCSGRERTMKRKQFISLYKKWPSCGKRGGFCHSSRLLPFFAGRI